MAWKTPYNIILHPILCQKLDGSREGSLLAENENQDSPYLAPDPSNEFKHRRSSSRWNEELSPASSTVTDSTQAGELISGSKLLAVRSMSFFLNNYLGMQYINFLLLLKFCCEMA